MKALLVTAIVLALGALVTAIGSWLIGRAHPPRGRFIEVRRLRQHVVELGTAPAATPPIVLIHGAGCNLEDMRLAFGESLAASHRVILIDRPGMGWSRRRGREASSPQYQAAILREVLDQIGVERAIIVGHSCRGAGFAGVAALPTWSPHNLALCAVGDSGAGMGLCVDLGTADRASLHRPGAVVCLPAANPAARLSQALGRSAAAAPRYISCQFPRYGRSQAQSRTGAEALSRPVNADACDERKR